MSVYKYKQTPLSKSRASVLRTGLTYHLALSILLGPIFLSGCTAHRYRQWDKTVNNDTSEVDAISIQMDNPEPHLVQSVSMTSEPVTALTVAASEVRYVDLGLSEVLRTAMEHSTVLRDIGGVILRSPDSVTTGYATRLQEADPRFGMEAALSAFDAQLKGSAAFNNNNRIYNNSFFAGGATGFTQDLHDYQLELSKRTASGSTLAIRGVTNYDANNAPANTFRSSWDTWLEGEVRQPLLQGGGLEFNRIAGPGSTPGVYNGLLIAKANADINHAEFVSTLRNFVSNVENAYWDLYLAYRELDARKKAMEKALVVWNEAVARKKSGASASFDIAEEALARQQYYQLKSEVDEAISGRLLQGTQTQNGSSGGTLQAAGGVLTAERRLRLLIGYTSADAELIRPSDEPPMAPVAFDWQSCVGEAIQQRPEIQRQHIQVKKREMELLAARNFLNPRLDAFGRYRWRGFGDDLLGSGTQTGTTPASAIGNLATGQQQEWTLGVELTVPIGYRKAHAAVQHAELAVARERAIQREQQRDIESNLSGALADAVRAYQSVENNLNQYLAANEYVETLETRRDAQQADGADRILDGHRRLVQAEMQFFRARAEYAVALKNVHFEKGSLLRYKDLIVNGDPADMPYEVGPPQDEIIYEGVLPEMMDGMPVTPPVPAEPSESAIDVSTVPASSSVEVAKESQFGRGVTPVGHRQSDGTLSSNQLSGTGGVETPVVTTEAPPLGVATPLESHYLKNSVQQSGGAKAQFDNAEPEGFTSISDRKTVNSQAGIGAGWTTAANNGKNVPESGASVGGPSPFSKSSATMKRLRANETSGPKKPSLAGDSNMRATAGSGFSKPSAATQPE